MNRLLQFAVFMLICLLGLAAICWAGAPIKGRDAPLGQVRNKTALALPMPQTINGTTYTECVVDSIVIFGEDSVKIVYGVGKTTAPGKFVVDYIRVAALDAKDSRSCLYRTFGKNVDKQAISLMLKAMQAEKAKAEAVEKLATNPPKKGLKGQP